MFTCGSVLREEALVAILNLYKLPPKEAKYCLDLSKAELATLLEALRLHQGWPAPGCPDSNELYLALRKQMELNGL